MRLTIKNLSSFLGEKQILNGINLEVRSGELHAIMGPNGSGKSTLAATLMGHPSYEIRNQKSEIRINNENIIDFTPDGRARMGLFLAFQNPTPVPGVTVANLLKTAYHLSHKDEKIKVAKNNPTLSIWKFNEKLLEKAKELAIPKEFLRRGLNEEFSGGEKKKLEMLQASILSPKFAIFDEIDTGLDVDALKIVAEGIQKLKIDGTGIIIITHYMRILKYVKPDKVHILVQGKLVASGDYKLAEEIEKNGYKKWS